MLFYILISNLRKRLKDSIYIVLLNTIYMGDNSFQFISNIISGELISSIKLIWAISKPGLIAEFIKILSSICELVS